MKHFICLSQAIRLPSWLLPRFDETLKYEAPEPVRVHGLSGEAKALRLQEPRSRFRRDSRTLHTP